ncbi:uncharacterized protein LOC120431249 [Culex pipiens pallens]|uniref:uncharacterized protein LOC120431249 n=1 Tax=Culex pipiens pallens TaxID=42434 RepID=UPI001954AC30|nr:uncharacterized protein LOC120431249 [Culex pipiens pallens]
MAEAEQIVLHQHASSNTIHHCMYGYYCLKLSKVELAKIYGKHPTTISNWIQRYDENQIYTRKERERTSLKFTAEERAWIVQLYQSCPVLLLDEAKLRFEHRFNKPISVSSVHRILHMAGFTWKVIERRAVQLRISDVYRYSNDLSLTLWDYHNLVFIDEVSVDNKGILRSKGYSPSGERIIWKGEFVRKPRVSLLSFIGYNGLLETFSVEGTFTRSSFFECVRNFATSGKVMQHPGVNSVWILDGAKIHCHHGIVEYLRSMGIIVIFLPAYSPFYNPIELVFGYLKRYLKRTYVENCKTDLVVVVARALKAFRNRNCINMFRKCGYLAGGRFDPSIGLKQMKPSTA